MVCVDCLEADLSAPCLNVKVTEGDTGTIRFPVTDTLTGERVDLTGYTFAARYRVGSGDYTALSLLLDDVAPDPFDSVIIITFPDTLPRGQRITWDLRETTTDVTWLEGHVAVE